MAKKPSPAQDLKNASAPLAHVPAGFSQQVYAALEEYCLGANQLEIETAKIEKLARRYNHRKPTSSQEQRVLLKVYTTYLQFARHTAMSLAYLWRNSAFLPAINKNAFHNSVDKNLGLNTYMFTNKDVLQGEIEGMQLPFVKSLSKITQLMKASRWEIIPGLIHDPYVYECLDRWMISAPQFNDWVEYNFYRTYQIPLNMLRCTPEGAIRLNHDIQTIEYCKELVRLMVHPAPGLRLQTKFPGISLDGMPKTNADFKFMIPYVVEYVSKPFGPHAAIIPTSQVRSQRPDFFAALRQK